MDKYTRLAIVDNDKCKPSKCNKECSKKCPVVKVGKLCIEIKPVTTKLTQGTQTQLIQQKGSRVKTKQKTTAYISETLCVGCGVCTKSCPFEAIKIINIPKNLEKETIHRYGMNSFKLHRLPLVKKSIVTGIVGSNGTGKSTAIKIIGGKLIPNLGMFSSVPDKEEIIRYHRGSELQNYFSKIFSDELKTIVKPQHIYLLQKVLKGNVKNIIESKNELDNIDYLIENLGLTNLLNKSVSDLSGGELQRLSIAIVMGKESDVYIFDEPTSFLDIKQRINIANCIRKLADDGKYVIVVEHDLAILDYLSDNISFVYGEPSVYGVITKQLSTSEAINSFLDGYIQSENVRFRKDPLNFNIKKIDEKEEDDMMKITEDKSSNDKMTSSPRNLNSNSNMFTYPRFTKEFHEFKLLVEEGYFKKSEIIVLLGENGTGKTTFIRLLHTYFNSKNDNNSNNKNSDDKNKNDGNSDKSNGDEDGNNGKLTVSYKPQNISPKFTGTVKELFYSKGVPMSNQLFKNGIMKPLMIEQLLDLKVSNLSGGEIQRVAIILCLGKKADIYLIDEPSAYLDSEQRIEVSRVIKRYMINYQKTAFIVEHDFMMSSYLADKIIRFEGIPSVDCKATSPQNIESGLNDFLRTLNVTLRKDKTTGRPRINKINSQKDKEQKELDKYYIIDN